MASNAGKSVSGSQSSGSSSGTSGGGKVAKTANTTSSKTKSSTSKLSISTTAAGKTSKGNAYTQNTSNTEKPGKQLKNSSATNKTGKTTLTGRTLTGGNNRQAANAALMGAASAKAQAAVEDVKAREGLGSGLQLGQWNPDDLVNRNLTGDNRPASAAPVIPEIRALGAGDWGSGKNGSSTGLTEVSGQERSANRLPATVGLPSENRSAKWSDAGENLRSTTRQAERLSFMGAEADPKELAQYSAQTAKYSVRPEQYTAENVGDYMDRVVYLAMTPGLSESEKQEAKEILKVIEPKSGWRKLTGNTNGDYYGKLFQTDRTEAFAVQVLAQNLEARIKESGAASAAGFGLMRGLGLGSIGGSGTLKAAGNITQEDENSQALANILRDAGTGLKLGEAYAQANNGLAYGAGSLGGTMIRMSGLGKLVGGPVAEAAIPVAGKLAGLGKVGAAIAKYLPGAAGSAATFGSMDALGNLGAVASGEMSAGDYLKSIGISAGAGAAGSVASQAVSVWAKGWLEKPVVKTGLHYETGEEILKPLKYNNLARVSANALVSLAFVGGDTAVRELANKLNYGKDYQPDMKSIGINAMTAIAFSVIHSWATRPTDPYRGKTDADWAESGGREAAGAAPHPQAESYAEKWFPDAKSPEEIKSRFRQLSKEYHPDYYRGEGDANKIMGEINTAYEYLKKQPVAQTAAKAETAQAAKTEAESRGDVKAAAQADAEMKDAIRLLNEYVSDPDVAAGLSQDAQEALEILNSIAQEGTSAETGVIALPGTTEVPGPEGEAAVAGRTLAEGLSGAADTTQPGEGLQLGAAEELPAGATAEDRVLQNMRRAHAEDLGLPAQNTEELPVPELQESEQSEQIGQVAKLHAPIQQETVAEQRRQLAAGMQANDTDLTSPRELGLAADGNMNRVTAAGGANLTVMPERTWDTEMQLVSAWSRESLGLPVSYVQGNIYYFDGSAGNSAARQLDAGYTGEGIILRADSDTRSVSQIFEEDILEPLRRQEGAGNETRQGVTAQEEPGILGPQEAQQGPGEAPAGAGAAGIVRADADAGTAAAVSGEQAAADGSRGRYSDGRAGGEAGRLDRNAGTGSGVPESDGQRRNAAGQSLGDAVRKSGVTPVSSKAFGLDNGTDRACVYRVPEEMLPENLRNRIYGIEAETGCGLEFFAGPLEVIGVDGYVHKTNGFFDPTGRRICVRVDHEIYEAWQILAHEEFHALAERDPWLVARIRDRIVEQYGRNELREILKGYILRRRGISNIESGSMSVFSEEAKGMLEEIFADANGMMNAFGLGAQQFFMPVLRELNNTSMSPQTQGGSRSSRGPPRYDISEDYENKLNEWIRNGKPDRKSIRIGSTSTPLQSIGVDDKDIWWDTSKVNSIQRDHPEITDAVLAQIPDILERPIIVMESKTQLNRLTMFGEVYRDNGLPVMAVMELLPTSRKGYELDELKLVNTYTLMSEAEKQTGSPTIAETQKMIGTSNILYIDPDKKRTDSWLSRNQLQLPLGITSYGSIGRITLVHRNVNGLFGAEPDTVDEPEWKKKLKGFTAAPKDSQKNSPMKFSVAEDEEYLNAAESGDTKRAMELAEAAAREAGYTIRAYHGTARADRVGNVFRPDRATSGPMAYFTSSPEVAENYAAGKKDTSLAYEENFSDPYKQFRVQRGGKDIAVGDLWNRMTPAEKRKLTEDAKHITFDDDWENIVYDPDATAGLGNMDDYTIRANKGNVINALIQSWVQDGNIYGEEGRFLEVLKLAGIEGVTYNDPNAQHQKVYDSWLKIEHPFNTDNADEAFADAFERWYAQQDPAKYERVSAGADLWDKNNQTAASWLEKLRHDIKNGTTNAWTVIPDSVTDYLKSLGHDGIIDRGGKGGGAEHTVYIPFTGEQVKSAEAITRDDSGRIIPLSERFNQSTNDIRFSYTDDEDLSLARENTPEYNEAIAPCLEEHHWPENFPQTVFNTNLPGLKYDRALHDAAKSGDRNAADQIVRRVIKPDRVQRLAETYPDAMVVPVWNSDTEAGNMLPYAYAEELANYGLTIDDRIIQIQKGGHTDTDGIHRLMSHSVFEGEVSPGQSYILVDDVQTFGGTLNDLRMYIESKGGKVVAVTTLAVGRNGSYLAARPETVQAIYDRHGEERINNLLRKAGIAYDAASLTDRQARYIRDVDYDTLRDRIREKASPGEYQGGAPDRGRAESQRAGGEGSAEQRLKFSFDDEEDLTLPGESAAQSPALRQAIGLVRQGALPSEVFNETGLVKMANGNLIDPDSGEIIWRNDNGFEGSREEVYPGRETEGTAETEVPEYDGRGTAGRSGKRLPGRRSWRSLSGDRRKAITDTVTRHVREHSTPDLRRLRVRYTDAAFAEEVYRRYLQDRTAYETDELIELIPDAGRLYDAIDSTVNKGDSEQKFSVSEDILPGAQYGSSDVTFNDTTEVPFRWAVVPLGSLTVSNDVYGNINPNYPQELQPRDRTRADSLNQTQNIANSLIPRKLEESADIQNGAPVVRGDGVVISGNGRSIAMMMAYDRGKADGYVEYLRQNAGKWGLDPESIPEDRPVLVRVAEDGQDWTQLARDANVSTIAGRSASEQARTDARNLERHPEVLEKLITDEDGNLNTPANREFISDFIQSVIPENERNEMHTSDGLLTQDGLVRVQRAIFEMAYGDASLLERLSERLDNDMKNVTNALLAAAPGVVSYENGVTNGTRYDIGLRDRVLEAIRIYTEARQNGETVALLTANLGLDEAANEKSVYVARFIEMNKASGRQLRIMLNALSETADELGDPNQVDFFTDEEENKTFDQVLEGAISKYEQASGRQLPRPERWGSGTLEEVGETAGLRGNELRDYYLSEPGGQHAGADAGRGELRGEEPGGSLREGSAEGAAENTGSEPGGSLIPGEAERLPDTGAAELQGSGESQPSEEIPGETPTEPGRLTVGAASEEPSEGARRILEEKRRADRQVEQGRKKPASGNRRIPDYNREPEGSGKSFREIAGEIRARAAEERARRLERVSKEKFFGTEALSKLGVKIEGALGNYHGTRQLREIERAAQELKREIRKQEKLLNATEKEKQLALGIAAGIYSTEDLGLNVNRAKVEALADYYELERTINDDLLMQRRRDINLQLDEEIQAMLPDDPGYKIPPMFVLNHRTPERLCRNIWGDEKGKEVYDYAFRPVAVNEAEKIRWVKKQFDDVREIAGKDGTKSELTRDESMLAQQVLEGRAAAELVAGMELQDGRARIESVAQNILNGDDAAASAQEFGLTDKERGIAEQYARWLQTKAILDSGEFDTTKIDNAVEIYKEKYNLMYDAINDFLVAHGYKPIGFIRGYAPHMQMQEDLNVFAGYLRSLGINEDVTRLPTNIAGRTAGLKPNKRWNPYFLQRSGDVTDFDIAKGFQSYITYLSDVLYHTDDTMRIRAMSRHYRELFAPENIKENLSWARHMNSLAPDVKREQLQQRGILNRDAAVSEEEVNDTFDKWIQEQFDSIENTTKYSDLVMYLDNYANILTGKQSMSDRGGEYDWGRESLTRANKIITAFARTQVAGNLSSAFSQLSQIPMIQAELGPKYVLQAVRDFASGTLRKGGFAQQSDHLTERAGSGALVTDRLDMVMDKMFSPLRVIDGFTAAIAVRAKYLQQIEQGKSHAEAMKEADAYAKRVQGSRAKGSKPLAFHSKKVVNQMLHLFQLELFNSWEHVSQDIPADFREIEREHGKATAVKALARVIVSYLLTAFLLNRVTEETYGGTPAPFDLLGITSNFIASGYGLTTNRYLETAIDNVLEKATEQRLFGTDPDDMREEFKWSDALSGGWYEAGSDIPYLRNIMGLMGLGDQSLPLPLMGLGDELKYLFRDAKSDLEAGKLSGQTGMDLLRIMNQLIPGGRQLTKTEEGLQVMTQGGRYVNGKLYYPVDNSFGNWVKAILFGRSALEEGNAFYAGDDKALSLGATELYQMMTGQGSAEQREAYDALQTARNLSDDQTEWLRNFADGGGDSWAAWQTMQEYKAVNADDTLGSYEKGRQTRAVITGAALTDEERLALYRVMDKNNASRADKLETIMESGLSWAEAVRAYDAYAEIEAREDVSKKEQAEAWASWVNHQNFTDGQKNTIREQIKFWGSYAIEDTTVDSLTESGLSPDSADLIAELLGGLEPTGDRDHVTDLQKYQAIVSSGLSEDEQWRAIIGVTPESYTSTLAKITVLQDMGVSPEVWTQSKQAMYDADDAGNDNGSTDQKEAKAALDGMKIPDEQKAILWQLTNKSWSWKNNPYDKDIGQEVYALLHDGDTGNTKTTKKKSGGRGGRRRGGGGKKTAALEVGAAFDSGHSGMFDSVLLGWKRKKYSRAQILAMVRAGLLTQEEADEILATLQETDDTENAAGTDGSLTLGAAEG